MAVQTRNSEMVDLLSADFVNKRDTAYAWGSLMQMYQGLPGIEGFWSMAAINKDYVQRFGYSSGYDHIHDALGIGTIDPTAGGTITPCITAGQADNSTAFAIVDTVTGQPRMAINGVVNGGFQMYDHAGGVWNLGLVQYGGDAYLNGRVGGPWLAPSFGAGWGNYDPATWQVGGYKKFGDLVIMRGLVARTSGVGTTIMTLPAGYVPTKYLLFGVLTDAGLGRIDISTTGTVSLVSGGATWVSFNDIPPFSVVA